MSFESEQENRRRLSRESRESSAEFRENKEGEVDEELQKAAAMERADLVIKEVKSSQKQMQNIARNMQEVQKAIRQLRAQLQLAQNNDDPVSVVQDKKRIEELKNKIAENISELENMREDLIREQLDELQKQNLGLSELELKNKAEELVEELINGMRYKIFV